eukprot:1643490-Rhodomonas_salina.1
MVPDAFVAVARLHRSSQTPCCHRTRSHRQPAYNPPRLRTATRRNCTSTLDDGPSFDPNHRHLLKDPQRCVEARYISRTRPDKESDNSLGCLRFTSRP